MGCCILQIAMTVFGITTLVKGEFKVGADKVVLGPMAYVIGLILASTLPLAFGTAFCLGFFFAAAQEEMPAWVNFIEAFIVIGIGATVGVLGLAFGGPESDRLPFHANDELPPLGPPKDPNNPYAP